MAHGVPPAAAERTAHLPPVSTLFAAFLGYNPVQHLVGPQVLSHLAAAQQATLEGRDFFAGLISAPFRDGLHAALDFAIVASLLAAGGLVDPRRALRPRRGRAGARGGRTAPAEPRGVVPEPWGIGA